MASAYLSRADRLRLAGVVGLRGALGLVAFNRWPLWLVARLGLGAWLNGVAAGFSRRYAARHLWTRVLFRRTLVVVGSEAMDAVLASGANTADPWIKKAAVSIFAPGSLVISTHPQWRPRRAFNEEVLGFADPPPLRHAAAYGAIVDAAVANMAVNRGRLRCAEFQGLAQRISQQVLFGAGASTPSMAARMSCLVAASNLLVPLGRARQRFDRELRARLAAHGAGGPGAEECLAADSAKRMGSAMDSSDVDIPAQASFWFFVLHDALELHVARTLALILTRADIHREAREEARANAVATLPPLRCIDASLRESLRLLTPVPLLLRRAVEPFELDGTALERGDQILIDAAAYHRDPGVFGASADRFVPERAAQPGFPKVYYFSAGLQACAGQHLVVPLVTNTIAALLRRFEAIALLKPTIDPDAVPHLLDHYALEFTLAPQPR